MSKNPIQTNPDADQQWERGLRAVIDFNYTAFTQIIDADRTDDPMRARDLADWALHHLSSSPENGPGRRLITKAAEIAAAVAPITSFNDQQRQSTLLTLSSAKVVVGVHDPGTVSCLEKAIIALRAATIQQSFRKAQLAGVIDSRGMPTSRYVP